MLCYRQAKPQIKANKWKSGQTFLKNCPPWGDWLAFQVCRSWLGHGNFRVLIWYILRVWTFAIVKTPFWGLVLPMCRLCCLIIHCQPLLMNKRRAKRSQISPVMFSPFRFWLDCPLTISGSNPDSNTIWMSRA